MAYGFDNRMQHGRAQAAAFVVPNARLGNLFLAAAVIAMLAAYLVLNNGVSAKGFELRTLQSRISDLEEERQQLDLALVAGQSMETVDSRIQGLGFVPVSNMEFVGGNGAVAVR